MPRMKASALTGSPLLNFVPRRRLKVHSVQSSFFDHFSATPGVISAVLSLTLTSPVNSCLVTRMPSDSWAL